MAGAIRHQAAALCLVAACGGATAVPRGGPDAAGFWNESGSGGAEGGNAADGAPGADTGSGDGLAGDAAPTDDSSADAMTEDGSTEAGRACPDVRGAYAVSTLQAQGCGTLFGSSPPCIGEGPTPCAITFVSVPKFGGDGGPAVINGQAHLESNGGLADATLTVGNMLRTGCVGSWDGPTATMTIDCGGRDASGSCVLVLKRSALTCN